MCFQKFRSKCFCTYSTMKTLFSERSPFLLVTIYREKAHLLDRIPGFQFKLNNLEISACPPTCNLRSLVLKEITQAEFSLKSMEIF